MRPDRHEIYGRRRSRNLGLGLVLLGLVLLTFAVTLVKLSEGAERSPQAMPQATEARGAG